MPPGAAQPNSNITRDGTEARVLEGLKHRLMAPELVREFVAAFQAEVNRSAAAQEQERAALQARRQGLDRKIAALVSAIENGRYSQAVGDRLAALEAERNSIPAVATIRPRLCASTPDLAISMPRRLAIWLRRSPSRYSR